MEFRNVSLSNKMLSKYIDVVIDEKKITIDDKVVKFHDYTFPQPLNFILTKQCLWHSTIRSKKYFKHDF